MRIATLFNAVRALAIVVAFVCCGCIDVSSSTPATSKTTCTTSADGTQTCTSTPTGGSHWSFFL
jgi:hypothetical protein